MPDGVWITDPSLRIGGESAPVSSAAPVGTEPGLYVRIVSPGGVPAGPVTIADGADVAEGATTDPAWVAGAGTVISLLKKIASAGGSAVSIADGADAAEGTTTDPDTANTVIGRLKKIVALLTATLTVTGPLTDAQLRATPVPVSGTVTASGPLTDAQLRATAVPVSGPLTDAQLRATPVPVSGTVTASGPLTDAQLRASAVPVSLAANQSVNVAQMAGVAPSLNTGVRDAGTQRVTVATNDLVPISAASLPLPTGAATEATLDTRTGSLTEAAPATDTASSGLNGRLQRIAQRLTSLIALLPAALVGGRLDTNVGAWLGSTAPSIAQKTMANSLPVVIASDQTAVPVSGTVTVTPPTLTKGTQGATGFSTQDLKDAGRVNIMWTAEFAHAQVAETLLTITESRDGAATATFTTKVVTTGKRLRITSVALEAESLGTGTTPQRVYLRMRFNTAGAVIASSPLQGVYALGVNAAVVKASEKQSWPFPDGVEFLGDGTKQIGFTLETPDWVVTTATGRSKVTITAFEY